MINNAGLLGFGHEDQLHFVLGSTYYVVSYSSLGFYTYHSGPSNSDTGGFWVTDE